MRDNSQIGLLGTERVPRDGRRAGLRDVYNTDQLFEITVSQRSARLLNARVPSISESSRKNCAKREREIG